MYDIDAILSEINTTRASTLDANTLLSSLTPYSAAEIRETYRDVLTWGEANYLSKQVRDTLKKNKETESRILSRANPQLTRAVRLAIDQSRNQRDYDAQFGGRSQQYVAAGSVASMFSPAGYLTELYREARDLHTTDNPRHLDNRRPDLTRLALSQDNMDAEVSTLSVANDIVLSSIVSREGTDDDAVMEKLSTWRLSGNTPYHLPYEGARQAILLQDPTLAALESNPDVAQQIDLSSLLAILADVSPELYSILTEEITADNATALYTKNFGTQDTARLLNAYLLAGYYDIPAEDVLTLTSLLGHRDYSAPGQYYHNNLLTSLVTTDDNAAGEVIQIVSRGTHVDFNYFELLPQSGDNYLLNFNFKFVWEPTDEMLIGSNGPGSSDLYRETINPQANKHYSVPVTIPADRLAREVIIHITRIDNETNTSSYDSVAFRLYTLPTEQYLLYLNKILRLYKATGLTPEEMYLLVYNNPGAELFDTGMLALAFLSLFYRRHYSLRFEDALVLAGGHISAVGVQGGASYFTTLFNTPLLNNREFVADGAAVDWNATDADNVFRTSVIRRGCQVHRADLPVLWQVAAGSTGFTATAENLALLYRTRLLAEVHGLNATELSLLLSVSPWSQSPLSGLDTGGFATLVSWLHGMTRWLEGLGWTVSELYLMVTTQYSTVLTPEIGNLVATLRGAISAADLDSDTLVAKLAPAIAAGSQLGFTGQAESILRWLDRLKPGGTDVKGFATLVLKEERTAAETVSLVTFCQILGQLTLLVRKTGISDYLLAALVAKPELVAEGTTVATLTLDTVQRLSRVNRRILQTGAYAQQVLTALVEGELTTTLLGQALGESREAVDEALALADSGAGSTVTSLTALDVTLQWLDFSAALNSAPSTVKALVALRYTGGTGSTPGYADWVAVSNLLQAGLSAAQTTALQQQLEERTSAALSSYYIRTAGNTAVADREQLYAWLLIDGLVSSQVTTTRVAEAIASLQLYVNRCQNGQEQGAQRSVLSRQFFTDWDRYNKRYSTWAGVSQLVYYPENYIDPTVRTGQTGMMDSMLNTLGQSELSADTVGDAFRGYMTQFEKIANLDVISAYHDNVSVAEGKTWFIGRSTVEGEKYYWRTLDQSMLSDGKYPATAWSEWLEIGSGIAAYNNMVRPVVFNDRLYVVWVTRLPVAKKNGSTVTQASDYFLSFSYLRHDGTWSAPVNAKLSAYLPESDINALSSKRLYCTNSNQDNPLIVVLFYTAATTEAGNENQIVSGIGISAGHELTVFSDANYYHAYVWQQYSTQSEQRVNFLFVAGELTYSAGELGFSWGYEDLSVMTGSRYKVTRCALNQETQKVEIDATADLRYTVSPLDSGSFGYNKKNWIDVIKEAGLLNVACRISTKPGRLLQAYTPNDARYIVILVPSTHEIWVKTEKKLYQPLENYPSRTLRAYILWNSFFSDEYVLLPAYPRTTDYFDLFKASVPDVDLSQSVRHGDVASVYDYYLSLEDFSDFIDFTVVIEPEDITLSFLSATGGATLDGSSATSVSGTDLDKTYHFEASGMSFPATDFRNGNLEVTVRFTAKNSLGQAVGEQQATITVYQVPNNTRKMLLVRTGTGAQYLQRGAYRVRINTLFARQLVARANSGLDAVLSMTTQLLQEPKLGKGNYVSVTFPAYNAAVHGSNANVQLSISPLSSSSTDTTRYAFWSGVLQNSPINVQIFVPTSQTAYGDPVQFPENRDYGLAVFLTCQKGTYYQGVFANITVADLSLTGFTSNSGADTTRDVSIEVLTTQSTEPMDFAGANALYFWEMFFYVPSMVFQRLLHESKFDDATTWMKYIWNPAGYYTSDGTLATWTWNVRPLEEDTSWNPDPLDSVDPDAVAQSDPMHYKVATFMRVLDLLIARGDAAYRLLERDTLNEAKMWYVQALQLLGDEPADALVSGGWSNPVLGDAASQTLAQSYQLDLLNIRTESVSVAEPRTANSLTGLFYPQMNDRLSSYWQTLRQRLYNLRHNLSIDGQPLYLPVYAAAASPSALLSAAVTSASGGDSLPTVALPLLRFPALLESARSLVFQLTQFGNAMLSITERQDAEALSLLLQNQGLALLSQSIAVQEHALTELDADKEALTASRQGAEERRNSYRQLYEENVNAGETQSMDLLTEASVIAGAASALHMGAAALDMVPNIYGLAVGGSRYGALLRAVAIGVNIAADGVRISGDKISRSEIYRRRRQEWAIQRNSAEAEMKQIDAQLASLAVRRKGVELQKAQVETQLAQTQAQLDWLQGKFSGQALYIWLRGTLASVYYQYYDVAVARCLQAQRAWQWRFSDEATTFIKPGAWQGNWLGFMAGETLLLGLARMEQAWTEQDSRMAEIEKTVSLRDVYSDLSSGSFALATTVQSLVGSGSGSAGSGGNTLEIASDQLQASIKLADLNILSDYPVGLGSIRRIKQISVTLVLPLEVYQDIRAILSYGGSVVLPQGCNALAVSHGMNDSGQFQLDFNDERALPFEGIPVDDSGTLVLSFPDITGEQKDLLTGLTDIILHIRYTVNG
ncbi:neuraminidase-like domain-containing protein [Kosakonia sacchari]|uniref:Tc toxin subunit A-related protein n=1 Tax=Kosakonia sacchari TaxID=1158459 RepID=UPI0025B02412|nr:neuraminidase-like domain-containing protein [Kosakonia sacchari]MDN2487233.1 neuraminidase-like domain-containing protein [Kosakonia sacchari]